MKRKILLERGIDGKFPKVRLGGLRTPLEELRSISELFKVQVFIKRDDCTSFAMGGNKVRQLEYVLGDAISKDADTVISSAAVQSNHLRVLSAASAKLGLSCHVIREDRVHEMPEEYYVSGNAFLQELFGAEITLRAGEDDDELADSFLEKLAARAKDSGAIPYVIGASLEYPALGALGYVEAAAEMLEQIDGEGLPIDAIVVPSGSAQTHAGLLVGLRRLGSAIRVYGICVRRDKEPQRQRVLLRAQQTAALIGEPGLVKDEDIWVTDAYLGDGYGLPSHETVDAIRSLARAEGLVLDPVYSGKAMAGLLGLLKSGELGEYAAVAFLHTGGTPAVFAYRGRLSATTANANQV